MAATKFVVTLQEAIHAAVTLDIIWKAMDKSVKVNNDVVNNVYFYKILSQM